MARSDPSENSKHRLKTEVHVLSTMTCTTYLTRLRVVLATRDLRRQKRRNETKKRLRLHRGGVCAGAIHVFPSKIIIVIRKKAMPRAPPPSRPRDTLRAYCINVIKNDIFSRASRLDCYCHRSDGFRVRTKRVTRCTAGVRGPCRVPILRHTLKY